MKTLLSVIIAAGIGFAAAFVIASNQKDAAYKAQQAKLESEWQSEKDKLQASLAREKSRQPRVEQLTTEIEVSSKRSPKEILEKLLQLKPSGTTRIYTIRKIIHELEDLAVLKEASLPAIREFLARNADLDYSSSRSDREDRGDRGDRGGDDRRDGTPPWQRSSPPTEFTLPPSLRIGLFDVLKDIGVEGAEQIMGEVLGTTGRAVEVAYLTRVLEELAPGKYREIALTSAKDLLRNPISVNNPNRLDEQAESYLYGILELYSDPSFVDDAKRLLVDTEGHLNRNAQTYLTKILGENMVGTYYDLYSNNGLTNTFDKMSVANRILDYVGPNPQANKFLNEVVANTNIDSRMRSFAVMRLAGGFGGSDAPTDPGKINQQIHVLDTIQTTDERVLEAVTFTRQNLQNILAGKPVENPFNRDRGGRTRRGPAPTTQ